MGDLNVSYKYAQDSTLVAVSCAVGVCDKLRARDVCYNADGELYTSIYIVLVLLLLWVLVWCSRSTPPNACLTNVILLRAASMKYILNLTRVL